MFIPIRFCWKAKSNLTNTVVCFSRADSSFVFVSVKGGQIFVWMDR